MTCICAITDGTTVHMGGDAAASNTFSVETRVQPKVFGKDYTLVSDGVVTTGTMLVGYTESFRMGQILEHSLSVPKMDLDSITGDALDHKIMNYMVNTFVPSVIQCFKTNSWERNDEDGPVVGGDFLVGFQGRLFYVGSDFQVGQSLRNYAAVGSGEDIARGAMYALKEHGPARINNQKVLEAALEAAAEMTPYVRPPFTVLTTKT